MIFESLVGPTLELYFCDDCTDEFKMWVIEAMNGIELNEKAVGQLEVTSFNLIRMRGLTLIDFDLGIELLNGDRYIDICTARDNYDSVRNKLAVVFNKLSLRTHH